MDFLIRVFNFIGDSVPMGTVIVIMVQLSILWKIYYIEKGLNNHVTDTNKKIDNLDNKIERKFERQDQKFDKLYEILLKEKKEKK